MASTPSIFQRVSLFNLSSLFGLALGLAIGMLGAVAWNSDSQPTNSTLPPGVQPIIATQDQALNDLRTAWVSEISILGDVLRNIAAETDRRGADAALRRAQDQTQSALRSRYSQAQAQQISKPWQSSMTALVEYAEALHLDASDASTFLTTAREDMQTAARAMAQAEGANTSSSIMTLMTQLHANLRSMVELSDAGKTADTYVRQQQTVVISDNLVDLLAR